MGCYFNHVPEITDDMRYGGLCSFEKATRVTIRMYKDHCFDGRRIWRLASVWLDEKPVMIIQNAGREGDDFRRRFIVDKAAYKEMVGYFFSLLDASDADQNLDKDCVEPDKDLGSSLTSFYGKDFRDHFEYY